MNNYLSLLVIFGLLHVSTSCKNQSYIGDRDKLVFKPELNKIFEDFHVTGSTTIYDFNNKTWVLTDTVDYYRQTLPASTFKIINMLIALETRVIHDEMETVKWVGSTDSTLYGYRPDIYRDITVREAFEVSAVWAFIELAKQIKKDTYKDFLQQSGYGNLEINNQAVDFWNFGDFAVSPKEQVMLLKNLYEDKLPFSKRNMDIVKRVMVSETKDNFTVRGKTGWTRMDNKNIGWWIGYLEKDGNVYFFATRIIQERGAKSDDFGSKRKKITNIILKDLNIL